MRAFYEYHAALVEPWDGPAALLASDGRQLVAALDRNGLRPLRYERSRDGLVVIASEVGVAGVDRADVVESGRVGPGQMLVVDPGSGIVRGDREVKLQLARRRPYRRWLAENKVFLEDTPPRDPAPIDGDRLRRLRAAFGYTEEELAIVAEMASSGAEPTGSMGDDTPPAALSDRPRPLSAYFKQHFAQVTNPPIDPQREALVMTLRTSIGAIGNLLGERPADCRRVEVPGPVLDGEQFAQLRELRDFQIETLPTLYDPAAGADALERAIDGLCRAASRAVWGGSTIVILSDRDVDASHAAIPALLATAAVHSHLVREGARARCGLVVESGEPRESMHVRPAARLRGRRRAPLPGAGGPGRPRGGDATSAPSARACSRSAPRWASPRCRATAAPRSSRRWALARAWSPATSPAPSPGSAGSRRTTSAARSHCCTRARSATTRASSTGASTGCGRAASVTPGTRTRSSASSAPSATTARTASGRTPTASTRPPAPPRSAVCSSPNRSAHRCRSAQSSRRRCWCAGSPAER